jgi:hypothetical protein
MDLVDDYSDWASDLKEGRFNSFIALAASHGLLDSDIPTFDEMLSAILHTSLLDLYVDKVSALAAQIEHMTDSIGATFWQPLLTDLRCHAMKQHDAFHTGFLSLSNLLFKGE